MARKAPTVGSVAKRLFVVLVATRNPLNIGAAARAMSNFGFSNLRVVSPYELAFREARSAVGASALLKNAQEYKSIAEAVADCSLVVGTTAAHNRKLDHELRPLDEGAIEVRKKLRSGSDTAAERRDRGGSERPWQLNRYFSRTLPRIVV